MRILAGLVLLVVVGGCWVLAEEAVVQGYGWERDVLYREVVEMPDEAAAYARERCRLDVYYPEGVEGFTTVVWFHAGGLRMGQRYVPGELLRQGFAVVAVDYRLNPEVEAPAYIEDAAAAVAWVFEHIEAYGGDPDRVIVAGASAGGYLVAMIGLDRRWLAAEGVDADRLLGIASLSGQAITHVTVREERGGDRLRAEVDDLAPVFHVRGDAPALMIVTGDRELELLGRYEENAYFARMMKLSGHERTELYELEGFDHAGVERPAHGLLLRFVKTLMAGE
ncbi:alpha/beta hydrolase [Mucisphaera sp.]|uniref:alpha/beta hydrolase n=1 Tax=Mucisphaera sp. TaxID=2913024 RepID=UPI003D11D655